MDIREDTVNEEKKSLNFIEQKVVNDLAEGKNGGRLQTRFPPEPNGYLHIGHAKAIAMDFGVAERHGGICYLRMDDTNPQKEDTEYVEAICRDIEWLGFRWAKLVYASDYFEDLWNFAVWCIKQGRAYVDEQTSEQIALQKGTPTQPGTNSPFRDRPVEESLRLFEEMNSGNVKPGSMILRAKIDMTSPNMHFRDPIIYRVLNLPHWRTGNRWNAYPMYDFTHGQSDYLEGVTHSICTLEFVPHHELYDLFVTWMKEWRGETDNIEDFRPRQFEFNKLNLNYTLMSKRNLLLLTQEGIVSGWDDPRMPTICGMRRRGYSPESILRFIDSIGYTTFDALNDIKLLEAAARADLNTRAIRVSAVLNPVKVVIENYPEGKTEEIEVQNNPENPADGTHIIKFSRTLWIERDDFKAVPEKGFFRMYPGKETRLKGAYIVDCKGFKANEETGEVEEIRCTYDPNSLAGTEGANRKVKGTIHWLSAAHAIPAEVRNYQCLWTVENPRDAIKDYEQEHGVRGIEAMRPFINSASLEVNTRALVEEYAATLPPLTYLQFQRIGYFNVDPDTSPAHPVFNSTVGLKDSKGK
ncbi:MAG: glutamine--tRNA ligase/YqeY domain fusion protein [Prevotella sp.]|nr:glutamine--tRNA ligase/YqeY domain fusion protein [Prevotella sp.]